MSMAASILQRGGHPNLVRNTITKARINEAFGNHDVNQDQKRLEEPRCKNCGTAKSRHDSWMAMSDEPDRHPFVAKKKTRS